MISHENLPDGYEWKENDGLFKKGTTKETKLFNAIPEVTCKKIIVNQKSGTSRMVLEGQYQYANGTLEPFCLPIEKIQSGQFMKELSMRVRIEIGKKNAVAQVFTYIIQSQIENMDSVEESEYGFGWNNERYEFEKDVKKDSLSEYQCVLQMAGQILDSEGIVTGFILAAIHGPIKRLLLDAGVQHDFTTCVSGKSGVGKTSLARGYCRYWHNKETAFSLGSDRKELKKKIRDASDVTVLVDDFNMSNSSRVIEHGIQVLAEIIQLSSDSCQNLVDDKPNQLSGNIHIITTVENVLTNVSTMNRCFLVQMDNKVTDECWRKFNDFIDNDGMWNFMRHFMAYVSRDYSKLVKTVREDYKRYLTTKAWKKCDIEQSRERIVHTYAVQKVLFKVLIDYFRELKVDMRFVQEVNEIGGNSIYEGCQLVVDSIQKKLKVASHTQYLLEFLNILDSAIKRGRIAYQKKEYHDDPDQYDFLCIHDGYLSFNSQDICKKLAQRLGMTKEGISSKSLANELKYFGVIKINTEGVCSFPWGTKKRMYHVRGVDLVHALRPDAGPKYMTALRIALKLEEPSRGVYGVFERLLPVKYTM